MLRSSWAVDDEIDQEDARIALSAFMMPGLRDPATSSDQHIGRAGLRPGYPVGSTGGGGTSTVTPGTVSWAGPKSVEVQPFQLWLPSSRSATAGIYVVTSDEVETVSWTTSSHGVYSRIDRLVVQQNDTYYGDLNSDVVIRHIPGLPASTPVKKPVDGSPDFFELASWRVPPGVEDLRSVAATNAVDVNPADRYSVPVGGILPTNTIGRDALTARGWPGLTIYNVDSQVLEMLTGPGGRWERLLKGSPVLPTTSIDPVRQPIQIDGTLYVYNDDLYLFQAPGTMRRMTYTNIGYENWKPMTYASGIATWTDGNAMNNPCYARRTGSYTAQMAGCLQKTNFTDIASGTLVAALPAGLRPTLAQVATCVTEYASDYATTAKLTISGTGDGRIYYYCPDNFKAKWIGLDNITYYLDKPPYGIA